MRNPKQAGMPSASIHKVGPSGEVQRLRLVLEAAPCAMLMLDGVGQIMFVNMHAGKLFGYAREELLGRDVAMLFPRRIRQKVPCLRGGYFRSPHARPLGLGREFVGFTKDRREIPIEISLNPIETTEVSLVLATIVDITERLNADMARRTAQANTLRQSILDSLPFSTIAIDTDGRILTVNPAAEQLLGYGRRELVGQSALVMHDPAELEQRAMELSLQEGYAIPANFQVIVASGRQDIADKREWTYIRKDGGRLPVNIAITAMRDDSGNVNGFLKMAYDITPHKRAEAHLRHQAQHDALTGLPNRTLLLDRLEMAVRQAQRHKVQGAVLMIDLDQFKRVNDTLGHPIGDQLLVTISNRLRACLRDVDTVARFGGDEFVVLLAEVPNREELLPLIGRITKAISNSMLIDRHKLAVTPSIGGCMIPQDGNDIWTLLKHADAAMYKAKEAGRANFQWFSTQMVEKNSGQLASRVA